MTLLEKHTALVLELGGLKINFQDLAVRYGSATAAQTVIDAVGVKLVALEQTSGIADARHLLAHETVIDDLPMFAAMVERYSVPVDWTKEIQAGLVAAEDVEHEIATRARILEEAKRSVATLTRIQTEAGQRRKKFSTEAMAIAREPDPLTSYERENFERLAIDHRGAHSTKSVFEKILQPA